MRHSQAELGWEELLAECLSVTALISIELRGPQDDAAGVVFSCEGSAVGLH